MDYSLCTEKVHSYKNEKFKKINFLDLKVDDIFISNISKDGLLIKVLKTVSFPAKILKTSYKNKKIYVCMSYPYFTQKPTIKKTIPTIDVTQWKFI